MENKNTRKFNLRTFLIQNNTYIIFIILFIVCCVLSENFFTVMNLRNIALQQAAPICVALGALFVILTGGIDLSVGSIMAFGACFASIMIRDMHMNFIIAILLSMVLGLLLGAFSGILVACAKMQGFVAALAGIFVASRTVTGAATIGEGQELDAITACVIGGASLSGGSGSVLKSVFGALVLALIGNIMNLLSVPSYPQDIIKGFIIIGAVLMQLAMEKSEKTV